MLCKKKLFACVKGAEIINKFVVVLFYKHHYDIEEIDRIGFTDGGYEIFIITDDYIFNDIPHFHYKKKNGFSSKLMLDDFLTL